MKLHLLLVGCLAATTIGLGRPRAAGAAPAKDSAPKIVVVTPDGTATQPGPAAPLGPAHTMNAMLQAIQTNDRAAFVNDAEPEFKIALTPAMFGQVTANFGARLRGEYRVTYFGAMKKKGYDVYLWKLAFATGGDDVLVEMSVRNGLVGGFWFL